MIFSVRYFEEGSSCRGRRKPPWRLQVEWRLERGARESHSVSEIGRKRPCSRLMRTSATPIRPSRTCSGHVAQHNPRSEVHRSSLRDHERFRKRTLVEDMVLVAVFDNASAHNSGTYPRRAAPTMARKGRPEGVGALFSKPAQSSADRRSCETDRFTKQNLPPQRSARRSCRWSRR